MNPVAETIDMLSHDIRHSGYPGFVGASVTVHCSCYISATINKVKNYGKLCK